MSDCFLPYDPGGRFGLTAERLREHLSYNPITGVFRWRTPQGKQTFLVGEVAGTPHRKGYIQISVEGRIYLAHRLAWLYVYGRWPNGQLDHRDLNKANNAIGNLREATSSQNNANVKKKSHTAPFKGVYATRNGMRFSARLSHSGRNHYLGTFDTAEDAHQAYLSAASSHYGEFARGDAPLLPYPREP